MNAKPLRCRTCNEPRPPSAFIRVIDGKTVRSGPCAECVTKEARKDHARRKGRKR